MFCSNYGSISCRFWDIQCQKNITTLKSQSRANWHFVIGKDLRFELMEWLCDVIWLSWLMQNFWFLFLLSLLRPGVHLSIRLVMLVHCIQMAEDIVKLHSRPVSPIILVFFYPEPSAGTKFQGESFSSWQQGRKIHGGWENLANFNWNRHLSQKRYTIGPWLLWNVNRKS